MARLLIIALAPIALGQWAGAASAQSSSGDHAWAVELDLTMAGADTPFGAWTKGKLGKLRFDEDDRGLAGSRVFAEYRGRLSDTVWSNLVLDYVYDVSAGVDVTEAYIDWRPVPTSRNKHQWRFGAFYPPLSLENGDNGWGSPLTVSYSAINSWLAEEVRPVGVQWSMRRRVGFPGSPHELGAFAGAFYGNDPAGTLLFWRGWSLHDRQSRLTDRLTLPSIPLEDDSGAVFGYVEQQLEPFHEIDHRPGFYAGFEWQYAQRASIQIARYDNRADPRQFDDGQWGWRTNFTQLSTQIGLPWRTGLIMQWMTGETDWLMGGRSDGGLMPNSEFVTDTFESRFLLLTRPIGEAHTVTMRYDEFEYVRPASDSGFAPDSGQAWTLAYRYESSPRWSLTLEWLEIVSERDVWSRILNAQRNATERQLQLKMTLSIGPDSTRSVRR